MTTKNRDAARVTDDEIAEVLRLDGAATKGPWFDSGYHEDGEGPHIEAADDGLTAVCSVAHPEHGANGMLITAARIGEVLTEMQSRIMPCGHAFENLIGSPESATTCGQCLQDKRPGVLRTAVLAFIEASRETSTDGRKLALLTTVDAYATLRALVAPPVKP